MNRTPNPHTYIKVMTAGALCTLIYLLTDNFIINKEGGLRGMGIFSIVFNKSNPHRHDFMQTDLPVKRLGLGNGRKLPEEILKSFSQNNETDCSRQRFLVYKCGKSNMCGGWGDREKGIISSFLLALLTNRTFVIHMAKPCELQRLLEPNVYNWYQCSAYLSTVKQKDLTEIDFIDLKRDKLDKIQQYDFDSNWKKQVIILRSNVYMIERIRLHKRVKLQMEWLLHVSREEAIHLILHTLLIPSQRLFKDIIEFHKNYTKGKNLVCAHIRMGQNPSIPDDANFRNKATNQTVIFDFLKRYDNISSNVIYIATDSDEVRKQAKTMFDTYVNLNRPIIHVDRLGKWIHSESAACEGFKTVLMEQYILSQCDTLVLTRSGFGVIAAYIRGTSENLFWYRPETNNVQKTNLSHIQTVFQYS